MDWSDCRAPVDTLAAVEDLLDGWPGTLIVVSHDRYLLERVTDHQIALLGDGKIRALPGGVEQYLRIREGKEPAPPVDGRRYKGESSSSATPTAETSVPAGRPTPTRHPASPKPPDTTI